MWLGFTPEPDETERFRETQRLWANPVALVVMAVEPLVITAVLGGVAMGASAQGRAWLLALWVIAAVVAPAAVLSIGLLTVVTDRRVVVRWWPWLPGRDVPLAAVRSAEPVEHKPLLDAGGWGWRISAKHHRAFTISGDAGVHVIYGDERRDRFLIGSRRAQELARAIQSPTPGS